MVTLSLGRELGLGYYGAMQFDSSQDVSDPQTAMVEECVLGLLTALSGSDLFESPNTFLKSYI